ncbi:hypothetical protein SHIRM173S_03602 [Streptomyces hirsutus]
MRLEEITLTDDPETVKEEATIALAQVERLTDVVQRLLTNSRDPRDRLGQVTFDLDEVIQQQLAEWRPAYRSAGRAIVTSGKRHLRAVGTPGAVAQVLAALIENSLMHGRHGRPAHPGHREPGRHRGHGRGSGKSPPTWAPASSSARSAATTPPASASRSPVTSPRRTAAGWRCSRPNPRSSACSCPAPRRRNPGTTTADETVR